MEHSTTSGRDAPVDATLADGLAGDTGMGIDVLGAGERGGRKKPIRDSLFEQPNSKPYRAQQGP